MATAKKYSPKKTTKAALQAKQARKAQSREAARQHSIGVRLGVISLTMLALAFLLLVLTKYQ